MKRALLALLLAFTSVFAISIPTSASAANCISLGFPSVTSSSYSIRVDVSVSSNCKNPFGLSGGGPVYSIVEENSLSSSCSGPYDYSLFGSGTISCTITIGGGLGSSRVGATSSTIKVWFAYDSSVLQKTFNHAAIPSKSNSSGGSGIGSTAGGSSSSIPQAQSCSGAPGTPSLTIEWNTTGPKFTFKPALIGEKATSLFWNFNLYDQVTGEWGSWSPWTAAPVSTGVYQASLVTGKSRIAFAVQAANACGSSTQARESQDLTGVALEAQSQDSISSIQNPQAKLRVGQTGSITSFASSKLRLKLAARSTTKSVCEIVSESLIKFLNSGDCVLVYSSVPDGLYLAAAPTEISFKIYPEKVQQSIPELNLKDTYLLNESGINLNLKSSAGLKVSFESGTEYFCSVIGDQLILNQPGQCVIFGSQAGDEDTQMAISRDFSFWIVENPKKVSITCVKGKISKKVTSTSPKCPSGYKKK